MIWLDEMRLASKLLTTEEAVTHLEKYSRVIAIRNLKHKLVFFTNEHLYGLWHAPSLAKDWVPVTTRFPYRIQGNIKIPDGLILTLGQLIDHHYLGWQILQSEHELNAAITIIAQTDVAA